MFDANRKLLVYLAALLAGGVAFSSVALVYPQMLEFHDPDPTQRLISNYALVAAFTFGVFVASSVALAIARRRGIPGFYSGSPRICTLLASLPLIVLGPMVAVSLLFEGSYWKAGIHVLIVAGIILRLVVLEYRLMLASKLHHPGKR